MVVGFSFNNSFVDLFLCLQVCIFFLIVSTYSFIYHADGLFHFSIGSTSLLTAINKSLLKVRRFFYISFFLFLSPFIFNQSIINNVFYHGYCCFFPALLSLAYVLFHVWLFIRKLLCPLSKESRGTRYALHCKSSNSFTRSMAFRCFFVLFDLICMGFCCGCSSSSFVRFINNTRKEWLLFHHWYDILFVTMWNIWLTWWTCESYSQQSHQQTGN